MRGPDRHTDRQTQLDTDTDTDTDTQRLGVVYLDLNKIIIKPTLTQ